MIHMKKIGNIYICNYCNCTYKLEAANNERGNHYFCSGRCILLYDKALNSDQFELSKKG